MCLNFATFNDIILILNHPFILRSYSFIEDSKCLSCLLSLIVVSVLDKVVSSAKNMKLKCY